MALCLGEHSGQAAMRREGETNAVIESRRAKARRFMRDRAGYLLDLVRAIDNHLRTAHAAGLVLCVRLNGSTDIAFEGIRFGIQRAARGRAVAVTLGGAGARNIFDHYPQLQFVDYTKNAGRFDRALPANYSLILSRSEDNDAICLAALARGINVAVVFAGNKPSAWHGHDVIDGDLHDLRHLDPRGPRGVVIALSPKGLKAKRDQSGFVIRNQAMERV
jgi:hypothetical protein